MISNLMYIIFAIFGLSFLIFVHELGHYFMARRVGMKVETFAIGFGRPIYTWLRDGVKWQIGWLPFGGYVKIAGQDSEDRDPYEIPDGFFGKKPWDRIKVAAMGPLVNLALALVIFAILWASGGREKNFAEFTHKIGWIDPQSDLYASGLRPGDEITSYDNYTFESSKDHLYAPIMAGSSDIDVKGLKVDYATGEKKPFNYLIKTYPHPHALEKGIYTAGIFNSANYVIYDKLPDGKDNPLPEGSPMLNSGIEYGDRIAWADGEVIFSSEELNKILNDDKALLTILRQGKTLLVRVPRVEVQELRTDFEFKDELMDWQFEAGLNGIKLQKLLMIPYNLTNETIVENELKFIDKETEEIVYPTHSFSKFDTALVKGDKIIAIDGTPIKFSYELLAHLQNRKVNIIVERNVAFDKISSTEADSTFDSQLNWKEINEIAQSIGTNHQVTTAGNYVLLKQITPKMRSEFILSPDKQALLATETLEQKKAIESIEDPEKRAQALRLLQERDRQLLLGLPGIQDRKVEYNPNPFQQFANVFQEIWRMLAGLVSGSFSPKWMSGPIGIVQVVHDSWMVGMKEALFWLGAISLNLAVINLLPIPVLDGGTIMFSLYEMITKRRIPPKTLEKLIIPFAVLLIGFFVFLTYQDLSRIFGGFLGW